MIGRTPLALALVLACLCNACTLDQRRIEADSGRGQTPPRSAASTKVPWMLPTLVSLPPSLVAGVATVSAGAGLYTYWAQLRWLRKIVRAVNEASAVVLDVRFADELQGERFRPR